MILYRLPKKLKYRCYHHVDTHRLWLTITMVRMVYPLPCKQINHNISIKLRLNETFSKINVLYMFIY